MAFGSHRVLKRKGGVTLIEAANPVTGVVYSVRKGSLGIWSGESLEEAELQFEQAMGGINS